jgi:hypothetical protein
MKHALESDEVPIPLRKSNEPLIISGTVSPALGARLQHDLDTLNTYPARAGRSPERADSGCQSSCSKSQTLACISNYISITGLDSGSKEANWSLIPYETASCYWV